MCQFKANILVFVFVSGLTVTPLLGQHWKQNEPVGSGVREAQPSKKIPELLPIKFKRPAPAAPTTQEPIPTGSPIVQENGLTIQPSIVVNPATPGVQSNQRTISEEPQLRRIIEGESNELLPSPIRTLSGIEIIRQRYPDGKVQIERQVAQDNSGNYYNDGFWKLYNRSGQILAEGQFVKGIMNGFWKRWHPANGGGIFSTYPYNQFQGPFLSTTTFNNGKLEGVWTIHDRQKRKIFEIPYQDGKRHGTAAWFNPQGTRVREVTFYQGLIDGSLKEWNSQQKLVKHDEFISGKKILRHTTFYRPQQRESENYYLEPRLELNGTDDWWTAKPADYQPVGSRIQHGPAFAWHDNNQMKMKGRYNQGKRVGEFVWWHANGQKQLVGSYADDGLKSGTWIWWHDNGQKSIEGRYENDIPVGRWTWWEENGSIQDQKDVSTSGDSSPSSPANTERDPDPAQDTDSAKPKNGETELIEVPDSMESLPNPLQRKKSDASTGDSTGDSTSNAVEAPGSANN